MNANNFNFLKKVSGTAPEQKFKCDLRMTQYSTIFLNLQKTIPESPLLPNAFSNCKGVNKPDVRRHFSDFAM